jgi:hypothetical protein
MCDWKTEYAGWHGSGDEPAGVMTVRCADWHRDDSDPPAHDRATALASVAPIEVLGAERDPASLALLHLNSTVSDTFRSVAATSS